MVAGLIVFFVMWGFAADRHRAIYRLPERQLSGFFGSYTEPADVSFFSLDPPIIDGLLFVFVVHLIVHVFIGRGISDVTHTLCVHVSRVFRLTGDADFGEWDIELKMLAGALWPLTSLLIPFLLIALLFGALYRVVWNA